MIILARHGQAAWGTRDYDRLTETGTRQAQLLGRSFAAQGLAPTRLITGGMRRHEQTAAALPWLPAAASCRGAQATKEA